MEGRFFERWRMKNVQRLSRNAQAKIQLTIIFNNRTIQ
jgi:hypothetical protein